MSSERDIMRAAGCANSSPLPPFALCALPRPGKQTANSLSEPSAAGPRISGNKRNRLQGIRSVCVRLNCLVATEGREEGEEREEEGGGRGRK